MSVFIFNRAAGWSNVKFAILRKDDKSSHINQYVLRFFEKLVLIIYYAPYGYRNGHFVGEQNLKLIKLSTLY